MIHYKVVTKPVTLGWVEWMVNMIPPLRLKKYANILAYCKVRRDTTHLVHTVNIAYVPKLLSNELLRQYMYRKPTVHDKT